MLTLADIAKLENLYSTYLDDDESLTTFLEFEDGLVEASAKIDLTSESRLVLPIIEYWFKNYNVRIFSKSISVGTVDSIVDVMKMIAEHQFLEPILRQEYGRNMLAWMFLVRVMAHEINAGHPATNDVARMLEQWLGKNLIPSQPLKLEDTVDLLYGPGVWELFTSDALSPTDVPSHLFRQGLQAKGQGAVAVRVASEVSVKLPKDFDM